MSTFTIILLIYVILDIISTLILIALFKRKGMSLADLAWRLKWLCTRERNENEDYSNEEYFYDDDDVDDQGYGY